MFALVLCGIDGALHFVSSLISSFTALLHCINLTETRDYSTTEFVGTEEYCIVMMYKKIFPPRTFCRKASETSKSKIKQRKDLSQFPSFEINKRFCLHMSWSPWIPWKSDKKCGPMSAEDLCTSKGSPKSLWSMAKVFQINLCFQGFGQPPYSPDDWLSPSMVSKIHGFTFKICLFSVDLLELYFLQILTFPSPSVFILITGPIAFF